MGTALMPGNMRHRSTGVREYRSPGEAPSEALARRWKEREYIKTGLVVGIQRPFRGWDEYDLRWRFDLVCIIIVSSSEIHIRTDWVEGFFCATVYRWPYIYTPKYSPVASVQEAVVKANIVHVQIRQQHRSL
jgi:hypothetical protein